MSAACCAERSAAGPAVGTHAKQPVADQPSTNHRKGPEGQTLGDEASLPEGQNTPEHQHNCNDRAEEVPLQRSAQITSEGCRRCTGEKAGGAGHAGERPQRTDQARKAWMQALKPQRAGQRGRQQVPRALQPAKETVQGSAIHRSHDHVDGTKDGHDVGHLVSLENVGKDLQVVAVGSADLETPGGDVVVALD